MFKILIATALLGGVGLAAVPFSGALGSAPDRPDCPGKIVCPKTGELICRDQCPLIDPTRPDCPGRIVCPLTGELVCRDRCPLNADADADVETDAILSAELPACCRDK